MNSLLISAQLLLASAVPGVGESQLPQVEGITLIEASVTSRVDGSDQPVIIGVPDTYDPGHPTPLLVGLHTWSADYRQRVVPYGRQAAARGWLLVLPNFRGPNKASNPDARKAGGSPTAQWDIVDARAAMIEQYKVDPNRVFITGDSGGGHMTLLMAGKHPELWSAAAAWVPVTDLREWWETRPGRHQDLAAITGGAPGDRPEIDFEYARRSPRTFMTNLADVPVLLGHGDNDPLIPVEQSWRSFRVLGDLPGHNTLLHVFSGGHTGLQGFGLDWCAAHARPAATPNQLTLVTDETKSYYWADLQMSDESRLARTEVVAGESELSITAENLSGITLDPSDILLPDSGMVLAVRSDLPLKVTLNGLPGEVRLTAEGDWWRQEAASAGSIVVKLEASDEMRSLMLAW